MHRIRPLLPSSLASRQPAVLLNLVPIGAGPVGTVRTTTAHPFGVPSEGDDGYQDIFYSRSLGRQHFEIRERRVRRTPAAGPASRVSIEIGDPAVVSLLQSLLHKGRAMKGAMLLLLFLAAATILTSCEGQRLAQCDPNCPNGEVPRKEAPSLVQPPWWADPRDR